MKTKTKIGISIAFLAFLMLLAVEPSVYAGSCQLNPNPKNSIWVCDTEEIHQNKYPVANDLHFRAHMYECEEWGYKVLGYRVTVTCFPTVVCTPTKKPCYFDPSKWSQGVDVDASGANIPYCDECVIVTEFWLNMRNDIRKQDLYWTFGVGRKKAVPDHGWRVGNYITIYNDDDTDSFRISGLEYRVTPDFYADPRDVVFDTRIYGTFPLPAGVAKGFDISGSLSKLEQFDEGYVYFHWNMLNATGGVIMEGWAGHEIPPVVGGLSVPVDKVALLAPYIALAGALVAVTVGAAYSRKRWLVPKL